MDRETLTSVNQSASQSVKEMALPAFKLEEGMAESNFTILPLTMVHRYYATDTKSTPRFSKRVPHLTWM
jgi:hypothetical protein